MTIEQRPERKYLEKNLTLIGEVIECSALNVEPNDVLHANRAFSYLPGLISARNSDGLISNTEILAERARYINEDTASLEDIRIAQRDLSMWVSASTLIAGAKDKEIRHFEEGSTLGVPHADKYVPLGAAELVRLSAILDVPARTTDGTWASKKSPRLFTDDEVEFNGTNVKAEAIIKVCVGKNWDNRSATAEGLIRLSQFEIDSPEFAQLARKSATDLEYMVSGITVLRKHLTNKHMDYFMGSFMPLTKQFRIGDEQSAETLIHSGSQWFPFHILNALAGITGNENTDEVLYREANMANAPKKDKAQFATVLKYVSVNGTLVEQLLANPDLPQSSARGVYEILATAAQFRTAHRKAIEQSLSGRTTGESSGGQLPMALYLEERTIAERDRVAEILKAA